MKLHYDCLICNSADTRKYFSKDFEGKYQLSQVEYWRCGNCGFVFSKTHYDMSKKEWEDLNIEYHSSYHGSNNCPDDLNWVERLKTQAATITELARLKALPISLPWVDWGCGDGKLANLLNKNQLPTLKYERYEKCGTDYLNDLELYSRKYSAVINTSVFEHVREREILESINNLVADDGVLILHTFVAEEIPGDPKWFYLLPVHCSFFTNKSMQTLFEIWGYKVSIYHVPSRMWFWFKKNGNFIKKLFEQNQINKDMGFILKKPSWTIGRQALNGLYLNKDKLPIFRIVSITIIF
jgi:hypothetical protein